jgi:hypothetical protein
MVRHNDVDIVVPLDRTVDSLGDRRELTLVRRSQVASLRGNVKQKNLQNTNPSGAFAFVVVSLDYGRRADGRSRSFYLQAPLGTASTEVPIGLGDHFGLPSVQRPAASARPSRSSPSYNRH